MATVVFDFDSTIISVESLEVILESQVPEKLDEIAAITEDGLRGKITFSESLSKRLAIAAPKKEEVVAFGESAFEKLTSGMDALITDLQNEGVEVWVVSGGIRESILPLTRRLKIPDSRVHAVTLKWREDGSFKGIDNENPFCNSKHIGAKDIANTWSSPSVMVGDSMTDYMIYNEGFTDDFVLYTEHFKCDELLEKNVNDAGNTKELAQKLKMLVA